MKKYLFYVLPVLIYLGACKEANQLELTSDVTIDIEKASIVSVSATGTANNYTFNVGIKSTETGCDQYANWWEVISDEGELLYRRILAHSHVNEQPFVRSGGIIDISENQIVMVRAHMNTSGYGSDIFKGSVSQGFTKTTLASDFANELVNQAPLPDGCAF